MWPVQTQVTLPELPHEEMRLSEGLVFKTCDGDAFSRGVCLPDRTINFHLEDYWKIKAAPRCGPGCMLPRTM